MYGGSKESVGGAGITTWSSRRKGRVEEFGSMQEKRVQNGMVVSFVWRSKLYQWGCCTLVLFNALI